jgi:peptidoglycan hydrolase CwlO-like protein
MLFCQSILLSEVLRMQQDLEDEKNEATIKDLENKVKDHEAALEKKDFVIHSMEGSLAEAQAEIDRLNSELLIKSENLSKKRRILKRISKPKLRRIQICRNH